MIVINCSGFFFFGIFPKKIAQIELIKMHKRDKDTEKPMLVEMSFKQKYSQ